MNEIGTDFFYFTNETEPTLASTARATEKNKDKEPGNLQGKNNFAGEAKVEDNYNSQNKGSASTS